MHGALEALPFLIRAGPGTGKTWSMQQLAHTLARELAKPSGPAHAHDATAPRARPGAHLVPLVIYVQKLARLRPTHGAVVGPYLLREYIRAEVRDTRHREMLAQAFEMGTLVVLLDGIDEAAALVDMIADFILTAILPMRLRLVATSRPEGVGHALQRNEARAGAPP